MSRAPIVHNVTGRQGREVLRNFSYALGVAVTLVAGYFGLKAVDALWAFWSCVGAAALYAGARWVLRPIQRLIAAYRGARERLRRYPRLELSAATLTLEAQDLNAKLESAQRASNAAFARGASRGRMQVVGELLAGACPADLRPVGMALDGADLVMVVDVVPPHAPPLIGSSWRLCVRGVGEVKATMRVSQTDEDKGEALLRVVEVLDFGYIDGLKKRALTDSDPPKSVEIRRRNYEQITELEQEG